MVSAENTPLSTFWPALPITSNVEPTSHQLYPAERTYRPPRPATSASEMDYPARQEGQPIRPIHRMNPAPLRKADLPLPPAVKSSVEREIKLTIGHDFRLPKLPGTALPRRLLTSIYFDTVQYDLARAGITLRQRSERGKRLWQLKLPLGDARQEVELRDSSTTPPPAFRDLLALHVGGRRLMPVATLRVWRTGLRVRRHQTPLADITVDSVAVVKNACVIQRFREIEIELMDGNDDDLGTLEHRLHQAGAARHDGRPKLFRALSLPMQPADGSPADDAPILAHVKWALGKQVRCLLAHDPGTRLGADSESLHQMRVATRRLRAVLRAARPLLDPEWTESLQTELSWLGQILGAARDIDVQLAYFRGEAATLNARDKKQLDPFIADLTTRRAQLQEVVLSELKSARYLDLVRRLQDAAHNPALVETDLTLCDLARREFKKLRKVMRHIDATSDDATLHKLRIHIKRVRYAAELAEPVSGKPAARFIKRAQTLQTSLGSHQDAIQAETNLRGFVNRMTSVRSAFVMGELVERQRERRTLVRTSLPKRLKSLLKCGKQAWS